jgi:hypothetical protein
MDGLYGSARQEGMRRFGVACGFTGRWRSERAVAVRLNEIVHSALYRTAHNPSSEGVEERISTLEETKKDMIWPQREKSACLTERGSQML